jgi:hypothetical protein
MKKVYVAIGTRDTTTMILGVFSNKEDAENFANDFDKKHCDISEDDLYYSDEDFDTVMDWCQDTWHRERWDDNKDIPRMVPDEFDLDKVIADMKIIDIVYQNWEPTVVQPFNVIDVYEGPEKVEELYRQNRVKIEDLF